MSNVVAQAIMSLDAYVAKQDNIIGRLLDWLHTGRADGRVVVAACSRTQSNSAHAFSSADHELLWAARTVDLVHAVRD